MKERLVPGRIFSPPGGCQTEKPLLAQSGAEVAHETRDTVINVSGFHLVVAQLYMHGRIPPGVLDSIKPSDKTIIKFGPIVAGMLCLNGS